MGFRSSSGRCAPSRHLAESHPQVLIIARRHGSPRPAGQSRPSVAGREPRSRRPERAHRGRQTSPPRAGSPHYSPSRPGPHDQLLGRYRSSRASTRVQPNQGSGRVTPPPRSGHTSRYRREHPVSEELNLPERARLRELERENRELRLQAEFEQMLRAASEPRPDGRQLGPATVRRIHATLRSALASATRKRLIAFNPAVDLDLPQGPSAEGPAVGGRRAGRLPGQPRRAPARARVRSDRRDRAPPWRGARPALGRRRPRTGRHRGQAATTSGRQRARPESLPPTAAQPTDKWRSVRPKPPAPRRESWSSTTGRSGCARAPATPGPGARRLGGRVRRPRSRLCPRGRAARSTGGCDQDLHGAHSRSWPPTGAAA